jgi:uncharacterized Zn finger protein (UPF0148 family)
MPTPRTHDCPHCGTPNEQTEGWPVYCVLCDHRADVRRAECDCRKCNEMARLMRIREAEFARRAR